MNKINFENGEKISDAKVTIDGNDYEVTPAQYSGATPLSSYNLNQMQDNIESGISDEIDSRIKNTYQKLPLFGTTYNCEYINSHSLYQTYSGSNYRALLFGDGTMIISMRIKHNVSDTGWQSWGQLFGGTILAKQQYPIQFTSTPSVTYSLELGSGANAFLITDGQLTDGEKLLYTPPLQPVRPTTYSAASVYYIDITAIGTWK